MTVVFGASTRVQYQPPLSADHRAALLAQIVASPDDEALRLVYADAIGGPRGEAIALAAELARAGVPTLDDLVFATGDDLVRRADQHRRLAGLIAAHAAAWIAELDGPHLGLSPHGAWVDRAAIEHGDDVARLAGVLARAPIAHLAIRTLDRHVLDALAELPLGGVRHLELKGETLDAAALARLVAAMPRLVGLSTTADASRVVAAVADHPALVEVSLGRATDDAIAALAASPIARRLRALAIGGWDDDPAGDALADPIAVFAGAFTAAREISIDSVDGIPVRRTDLVMPPIVRLHGLFLDSFAALLPAFAPVRTLDTELAAGTTVTEEVPLAMLARSAPALERLMLDATAAVRGLRALAPLRLRDVTLRAGWIAEPDLRDLVHQHDLARLALELRGDHVGVIADEPRMRSLRALELERLPDGDAASLRIAGSPHLAGLRRLALRRTSAIRGGTLAEVARSPHLRELVDLDLPDARANATLAEHPTLVRVATSRHANADTRRALRARFGVEPARVDVLYVFAPGVVTQTDLVVAIAKLGGTTERSGSDLTAQIGPTRARLRVQAPSQALLALASELFAGPPLIARTQIAIHPEVRGAALVRFVQTIVRELGIVFGFDTYDDAIVEFSPDRP